MSIHAQGWDAGMEEAIRALPARALVKTVFNAGILTEAKRINPQVSTLYRHWLPENEYRFGNSQAQAEALAYNFFERFVNGDFYAHAPHIDYIEEYNEYLPGSLLPNELAQRLRWMETVARVWRDAYRTRPELRHIRLVLANQYVGNDLPKRAAEIAIEYDRLLSYHAYTHYVNGLRDSGDWRYHSGRWHFQEQAWGLRPHWIFTESGPYFNAEHGWKSGYVLGGDLGAYLRAVRAWLLDVKRTPAYKAGRVHGYALFTTGPPSVGWRYYQTRGRDLIEQARLCAAEWSSPDPPPGPAPAGSHIVTTRRFNLRNEPDHLKPGTRLYTMPAGTRLDLAGETTGAAFEGSARWYKATVYVHEAGARPE